MEQLLKQFDRYGRKARLLPAVLLLLPVFVAVAAWFPEVRTVSAGGAAALLWLAAGFALTQLSRGAGKSIERKLWMSWDGPPTTRFLRHREGQFNPMRRRTCHRVLQRLVPDVQLPSAEEESADPAAADLAYETCVRYLIRNTRDSDRYALVFAENINYGFHRNWLGLKPLGIILALGAVVASAWRLWSTWDAQAMVDPPALAGVSIGALLLLAYAFWITPGAAKTAAEAYAERLLEACEDMDS